MAIGPNVERQDRYARAFQLLERGRQPLGKRKAASDDAQQAQLREVRLALDDLVGNPTPSTTDALGVQDHRLGGWGLQHQRSSAHSSTAIRVHRPLRAWRK